MRLGFANFPKQSTERISSGCRHCGPWKQVWLITSAFLFRCASSGSCGIVQAGSLASLTGSAKWNEAAINVICHKLDFSLQLARAFQNFLSLSGLKNGLQGNKKKKNPKQTQHSMKWLPRSHRLNYWGSTSFYIGLLASDGSGLQCIAEGNDCRKKNKKKG